ncbi:hypothetical protein [Marinomonas ostreistagni]|uniref:Uncharacterized protein n=1 Tax=Marinomonas ostreistagni TaxID=359209 RepID=A0ABS0ZA26_9GAMM|nr:hypothetical protein [Marinomonas ostreistagni]MBJ7550499.1 hypothetical protein [Marinomonas ostreistagni]
MNKARAYQAYVMTFVWPENMTSEDIEYQDIFSREEIQPIVDWEDTEKSDALPDSSPFDAFTKTLSARTEVLSNKTWTLIFPDTGSSISESFHSTQATHGYPLMKGEVKFTLGRYLESDLDYKHYQFGQPTDSDEAPLNAEMATIIDGTETLTSQGYSVSTPQPSQNTIAYTNNEYAVWNGPTQVLSLHFNNKTASKKLNYIDHPVIGTLIYFEPLDLEEAIDMVTQPSLTQ